MITSVLTNLCTLKLTSHDESRAGRVSGILLALYVSAARQTAAGIVNARVEVVSRQLDAVSQQFHSRSTLSRHRIHRQQLRGHITPTEEDFDADWRRQGDSDTAQGAWQAVCVDKTSPLNNDIAVIVRCPTGSTLVG